ncbi:MAG TPA: FAD-binding protein, partial [Clostridia bacterium]|nr:FAD-binding protein [Clostridia bacterium]
MNKETVIIKGIEYDVYSMNTIVLGTGAAGYNAADSLYDLGQKDIAIITEGIKMGTSRNTGSDKQTYYKLTLSGNTPDSVFEMAQTLFKGGSMHGDIALVEAALSAKGFYKLASIGVPFPHNKYGEYIGYKTDHDPRERATSAGPLTSKFMTEKLEVQINNKGIRIFDGFVVIAVLTKDEKAVGLLAIDTARQDSKN